MERKIGNINYMGMRTLYMKEVNRFLKIFNQTLVTPLITSLLFLAVFTLAMGGGNRTIDGVNFREFIGCGLIIMAIVQQSFANTSSSFIMGKVIGVITDLLIPPLSALEITLAMAAAGMTRGLMVGAIVGSGIMFFVPMSIQHPFLVIFYVIISSMMLSLMGILAGILADSFDQMAAITNYFITPMSFLSGTFYAVKSLPGIWYIISHINPFFFMIDGFRYAMIGYSDSSIPVGAACLIGFNTLLGITVYTLLRKGYKIKS